MAITTVFPSSRTWTEETLDLRIVSQRLNEEIEQALEILRYPSIQAAIVTLLDEVVMVKNTLDNVTKERDKLRSDLQEEHRKAAVLAVEIDERNYQHDREIQSLKHKWAQEMKGIEKNARLECEAKETLIQETKKMFEMEQWDLAEIQRKIEKEVERLKERKKQLEDENEITNSKLREFMEENSRLKLEIDNAEILTGHLLAVENCPHLHKAEESLYMIKNVEELVRVNKELKDRNDELEINMLSIPFEDCSYTSPNTKNTKRKSYYLPESPSPSFKSKVTKRSHQTLLETSPPELKYLINDYELEDDEDDIISLSDIWCNFDGQDEFPSSKSTESCKTLANELDHVKFEIVKMMSEKGITSEENKLLEIYEKKISELEEENKKLKHSAKNNTHDQQQPNENGKNPETSSFVDQILTTERSSPDGQEIDDECLEHQYCSSGKNIPNNIDSEEKLEERTFSMELEKDKLLENNKYLEESLELMQTEFESMEDYWQKKIDEERAFYEDQLKVSETQFKELELKMKEYQEILESVESSTPDNKDNLYIIDEQSCLEEKVNEWEEEINQLKLQIEDLETAHEEEIFALLKKYTYKRILFEDPKYPGSLHSISDNNKKGTTCLNCGSSFSLSKKRKQMEQSWAQVIRSETGKSSSLTIQDANSSSSTIHLSLPPDCVRNETQAVKTLQEDCDQLLLKKGGMKAEIARSPFFMNNQSYYMSYCDGIVKQCDYEASEDKPNDTFCDASKQAPPAVDVGGRSVASLHTAFEVILSDISTQKCLLSSELSQASLSDKVLLNSLESRLTNLASRCQQLHSSLALQRARCNKELEESRQQHIAELSQLESLVASSQELVRKQVKKYIDQMEKLGISDKTIEKLTADSKTLSEEINGILIRSKKPIWVICDRVNVS